MGGGNGLSDAKQLFWRRLRSEWSFQRRVWSMVVDWVVALYLIVPALVVAGYHYVSWWQSLPLWAQSVSEPIWLIVLYVLCCSGGVRLFVEEADQLFLLHNKRWMRQLKGCGLLYSFLIRTLTALGCVALAAPFLAIGHGYSAAQFLLLAASCSAVAAHSALAGRLMAIGLPRVLGWAGRIIAYIGIGALFVVAAAGESWPLGLGLLTIGISVSTVLLFRLRLRVQYTFERDAAYEAEQRMKVAVLLMGQHVPKPAKLLKRKKPLLFGKSRALFRRRTPDRVLAETIVKSFGRSGGQLKPYAQFVLVCALGVVPMPLLVKWLFALAVALLLAYWIRLYGREVLDGSFLLLFPWKDEDRVQAIRLATPLLFAPAYAAIGLALGWSAYGWWAGLALLPIGVPIGYAAGRLLNRKW